MRYLIIAQELNVNLNAPKFTDEILTVVQTPDEKIIKYS